MTKYIAVEERNGMINMDGYTTIKNFDKAVLDIAKAVAKVDKGEGDYLAECISCSETPLVPNTEYDTYCFEMEEVGSASKYNEKTDEIITSDGAWYFHIRFVKQ